MTTRMPRASENLFSFPKAQSIATPWLICIGSLLDTFGNPPKKTSYSIVARKHGRINLLLYKASRTPEVSGHYVERTVMIDELLEGGA